MEEGIFMTKKEQYTYERVSEFMVGKISRLECATLLQIRERSISRIAAKIRRKGVLGAVHGNRGREALNGLDTILVSKTVKLVKTEYYDFNMAHCLEILRKEHGVKMCYESFRRICHKEKLVRSKPRRASRVHQLRARMPNEGLLLQMDGSHHHWNRKDMWCLIGMIDDATSDIPYAEFFSFEGTLPCMKIVQTVIEKKGVPLAIYVDKAEWFGGAKKQMFSQFKRACDELGIKVIHAHSPQAKGRIERTWKTIQSRIIPEMRLKEITTMKAANEYLQNEFLPNYWAPTNTVKARQPEIKYKQLPAGIDLKEVFCIKEYRKINGNHTIRLRKHIYALAHEFKHSIKGKPVEIRTYQDGTWKTFFAGKPIRTVLHMLEQPKAKLWTHQHKAAG
jgi:transposase